MATNANKVRHTKFLRKFFQEDDESWFMEMAYFLDQMRYRAERRTLTRRPIRTGPLLGHIFIHELIQGHDTRAYENFRMAPQMFFKLRDVLIGKGLLTDTKNVICTEQVAIFLHPIGHGVTNQVLSERFHHSGETISRHFNAVLKAVFSQKRVHQPSRRWSTNPPSCEA
ncbi:hypothetical protein QJS10_CPB11g00824 [Acorus calamus]|uniref:DUF8040 domain-containing protein n=1 Tax=Acorus calamus TaxID=4465 RepID=A0AAV9DSM3_ACOCL|nr:hypothetical protein QJS10_CPB11g00824 [Acorus calamus]